MNAPSRWDTPARPRRPAGPRRMQPACCRRAAPGAGRARGGPTRPAWRPQRGGQPYQGPYLRVGQLATGERLAHQRQLTQGAGPGAAARGSPEVPGRSATTATRHTSGSPTISSPAADRTRPPAADRGTARPPGAGQLADFGLQTLLGASRRSAKPQISSMANANLSLTSSSRAQTGIESARRAAQRTKQDRLAPGRTPNGM